jgi:hypothetical protein
MRSFAGAAELALGCIANIYHNATNGTKYLYLGVFACSVAAWFNIQFLKTAGGMKEHGI